ncbi:purine and uridine phosphorylase, partial [Penicillium malachiteum]
MSEFESTISQIDYLISWICILPSKYNKAINMFDEIYDSSNIVQGHDNKNSYDFGRIDTSGWVGSADQVMKNLYHSDQYAGWLDIICYEMEAIGVMETTSCLPIWGISDYSDGHKNDEWHSYASLSAA